MEQASIYFFKKKEKFLMHSNSMTKNGLGIFSPPYIWMDKTISDEELVRNLFYSLSCSTKGLPHPVDWSSASKQYLQSIGLKRLKDLYTDSLLVMVSKENDLIKFSSTVNMGSKGYMNKVPDFKTINTK